jgi:flagellar protein FliO/FliZ
MFDSLFGAEMPLPIKFILAFLIVLGLIGAAAWAVRRFGAGRLGGSNARGRQPRLAVIDHASVDARRRLILVRRDNVEHLLMIGGPTDVVVEANIVRAVAAPRDVAPRDVAPRDVAPRDVALTRPSALEPLPRAIPLPENGNGSSWPLQPEVVAPPPPPPPPVRAMPKIEPVPEEPAIPLQPAAEAPARPQRDTLAALADELSARPTPPAAPPTRIRAPSTARTQPAAPRPEPRVDTYPEPRSEPRIPSSAQPAAAEAASADQSLAEMAHRLEAALRKPGATAEPRMPAPPPRVIASEEQAAAPEPAPPPPQPRVTRAAEPKPAPARTDAKPNKSTTLYDNLEQEMASLLGRPTNKT